jgi:hypothetical protein
MPAAVRRPSHTACATKLGAAHQIAAGAAESLRIFSENFSGATANGWTFHEKSQLIGQ